MTGPAHGPAAPALRLARGFSCLFWSLPPMAAAHAAALGGLLPARETAALMAASCAPLAIGLWMLRAAGLGQPDWRTRLGRVGLLALATAGQGPFLAWWTQAQAQGNMTNLFSESLLAKMPAAAQAHAKQALERAKSGKPVVTSYGGGGLPRDKAAE